MEGVEASARHGHADDAAGVAEHERDVFGGGELAGETEIALVLAAFVVDDDHEAPAAVLFGGVLDAVERALCEWLALEVFLDGLDLSGADVGLSHGSASLFSSRSAREDTRAPIL